MGHDRSVSVVCDGELLGSLAAERIDRKKHSISSKVPFETIDTLLSYLYIDIYTIKYVGITYAAVNINNLSQLYADQLQEHYPNWNFKIIPVSHHLAHAASSYYTSSFDKALVFIADGGGDLVNGCEEAESLYIATRQNGLQLLEQRLQTNAIHTLSREQFHLYPCMNEIYRTEQISIAKKYEQITYILGFGWNQSGKTMGLASYGKELFPVKVPEISSLQYDLTAEFLIKEIYQLYLSSDSSYQSYIAKNREDIAKTLQTYTETLVINIIGYLLHKYQIYHMCLAGGLFLNCLLNHKLLEKYPEINIHICPAAGDDGQSIGAAYIAYQYFIDKKLKNINSCPLPYLGISYSNEQIKDALERKYLSYKYYENRDDLCKIIATEIYKNKIIGFFTGRSEVGPRALCHRSLLANATWGGMKDYLNEKVKHRENFRPFAPVVMEEFEQQYFKIKQNSPYMLLASTVVTEYASHIPSVVHIDQTARVQSVNKKSNPYIYQVIKSFYELSGVPVLLNTSFNDNGEPIVETPQDAINTFLSTEIDVLVLENFLIYK
jgi:carbamoyltransferase